MEGQTSWQEALERSERAGFRVHSLDVGLTEANWTRLSEAEPPVPVRTFADLWVRRTFDPWRVLAESVASVTPSIMAEVADGAALAPLRSLLGRTEQAAVVCGHAFNWTSPDQWGYLLHVRHAQRLDMYEQALLHTPALSKNVVRAEHVLAVSLPPSYRRFLLLTNGFGLGETERSHVCGAGPTRSDWTAVLLNKWLECSGQHEIAARWREFQGTYAYERIMDRERGENTFRSDETALIPFANTYEDWCFDRTRLDAAGEYRIVLWDHELRLAEDRYSDFDAWFAGELEPYLFGDS